MNKKTCVNDEIARDFRSKVDQILKKHSGIGVKKLMIDMSEYYTTKDSCYLNSWLLIAVTPGIEELALKLSMRGEYNFPCSLLSNGSGDSIRYLKLGGCSMRPTAELPWLKSLTKVQLHAVCITGDELGCLLCNSFALERLVLRDCGEIVCLKIPILDEGHHLCGRTNRLHTDDPEELGYSAGEQTLELRETGHLNPNQRHGARRRLMRVREGRGWRSGFTFGAGAPPVQFISKWSRDGRVPIRVTRLACRRMLPPALPISILRSII
jgi:hypothetical protein